MKKGLFAVLLFLGFFRGVNAQNYYIEGFYERHGEGQYTLKNVHTNGITLDGGSSLSDPVHGEKTKISCDGLDATMVKFTFKKADTRCPRRWDGGFDFQYWDEDNNKWKTDVEACRNFDRGMSQNDVAMMLVLDYSGSMRDNIKLLQATVTDLIYELSNVSNGNIHLGIIAFSGMNYARNQVFPITPLTQNNRSEFEGFIRNSSKGNETALYYSMDKAIHMLEEYVAQKKFNTKKFNGTFMISFTDGLDNASINDNISVRMHRGRKNEYLAYLSKQLKGDNRKIILEKPLESFAIGFTGSEDYTREDREFFNDVLQQTTPDKDHFRLASHFDEVKDYFKYICKNLITRWEDLNLYIGESQYGTVRWVLNCGEQEKVLPWTPKKPSRLWFGIGVDGGYVGGSQSDDYYYYSNDENSDDWYGMARIDAAWPLSEKLALGGTVGLGYGAETSFKIGPLAKFSFEKGSALLIGLGYLVSKNSAFNLNAGWKFKSPWYVNAGLNFGDGIGFGIGVGYTISGK